MKRQHAEVGVKYWDNQDFIDLQSEPLRALDGFFAQYGPCVVQGCEVTKASASTFDVAPGLVVLEGTDHEGTPVTMIVPFEGVKGVSMPLCLTLDHTIRERVYGDGKVKPIAFDYYAKPSTVAPTDGTPFFEIKETGTLRFVDVIQDPKHRFTTDQQQAQWSAKETPEGAQTKAEAALRNAKTYTDQKESVIRSDMATADTATLRDAKSYADTVVTALVDGSPEALNTLKELAAALGNDPDFATTVLQKIGEKLDYGEFTGDLNVVNTSKMYRLLSGCTNIPLGSSQGCFLLHTNWDAGAAQQMYFVYSTTDIYIRNKVNGTWKPWQKVWNAGNFNPDDKFGFSAAQLSDLNNAPNNAFFVGAHNAANAPVANSWSNGFTIAYGNNPDFRKQFCYAGDKWWTRGQSGTTWSSWSQIWDSGNFNPDDYLPLSGNKTITGNLTVANGFTSGIMKCQTPTFPQLQLEQTNTGVTSVLFVNPGNALMYRPNGAKPSEDYTVYHSGNFKPGNYLLLSGGTMTGDITFGSNGSVRFSPDNGNIAGVMNLSNTSTPATVIGTDVRPLILLSSEEIYRSAPGGIRKSYKIYDSGNFNPDDYLPKTTPTANGGVIVNGETAVGKRPFLKFHIPGVSYSQFVMDENGTVNLLNGSDQTPGAFKSFSAGAIFSNGNRVWDAGSFDPANKFGFVNAVSDLNDAPVNAAFSANRGAAHAPVADAYFQGFTFAMDSNPDFKRQWAFKDGKIWFRYMHSGSWFGWTDVIPLDNYLPLSGNKMITGDFQFKDGVAVRDAAGRSVVGLLDIAGDGVCVAVGNGTKKTRIVTPNDTPVYRNDGKGSYKIYDSSNLGNATTSAAGLMPAADKQKVDNLPGALAAGRVLSDGSLYDKCGTRFNEGSVSKLATGKYRVRHNIGHSGYFISTTVISPNSGTWMGFSCILDKQPYYFDIGIVDIGGLFANCGFEFVLVGRS